MTITDIRLGRRGGYAIHLDGSYALTIGRDTYLTSGIGIGDELDPDALEELRLAELSRKTHERALRLLSIRDHSAAELRDKLVRTADPETADAIVARLMSAGLIDDLRYAKRYLEYLVEQRGMTGPRLRHELMRKGLDRDTIDEALAELDRSGQEERLHALIERKFARMLTDERGRARATQALGRLGYRWDEIEAALNEYRSDDSYETNDRD